MLKFAEPLIKHLRRIPAAGLVLLMFAAQSPAFAQGCAMCKTTIAASADAAKTAIKINFGVLILLLPVLVILSIIIVFIYRHRDSFDAVDAESEEQLISVLDVSARKLSSTESLQ
jgi:hypothetical protein